MENKNAHESTTSVPVTVHGNNDLVPVDSDNINFDQTEQRLAEATTVNNLADQLRRKYTDVTINKVMVFWPVAMICMYQISKATGAGWACSIYRRLTKALAVRTTIPVDEIRTNVMLLIKIAMFQQAERDGEAAVTLSTVQSVVNSIDRDNGLKEGVYKLLKDMTATNCNLKTILNKAVNPKFKTRNSNCAAIVWDMHTDISPAAKITSGESSSSESSSSSSSSSSSPQVQDITPDTGTSRPKSSRVTTVTARYSPAADVAGTPIAKKRQRSSGSSSSPTKSKKKQNNKSRAEPNSESDSPTSNFQACLSTLTETVHNTTEPLKAVLSNGPDSVGGETLTTLSGDQSHLDQLMKSMLNTLKTLKRIKEHRQVRIDEYFPADKIWRRDNKTVPLLEVCPDKPHRLQLPVSNSSNMHMPLTICEKDYEIYNGLLWKKQVFSTSTSSAAEDQSQVNTTDLRKMCESIFEEAKHKGTIRRWGHNETTKQHTKTLVQYSDSHFSSIDFPEKGMSDNLALIRANVDKKLHVAILLYSYSNCSSCCCCYLIN
jgi:hypothetical protein